MTTARHMTTPPRLDAWSMARRAAAFIPPGAVVAVDDGLPALVPAATPPESGAWFLHNDGTLNDIPLAMSDAAALARGGYIDLAIVAAAQVDASGSFAGAVSAADPGLNPPGSTVDLAAAARRVIALLPHAGADGAPNIVAALSYPVDGVGCVNAVITDAAVIEIGAHEIGARETGPQATGERGATSVRRRLTLTELAPGWSVDEVRAITGTQLAAAPSLRPMDFTPPAGSAPGKVYPDGASALADVPDGATVFIDGFGGPGGMAHYLLLSLRDRGSRNLTIVSNTAGIARVVSFGTPPGRTAIDHSVLIENGQVAKAIASFPVSPSVSRPSEFELAYRRGEVDLELAPQGTLAERLRAGGAGIHAFYTPTGAGTLIAAGKETRASDGRDCVLEYGLRADYAIIRAHRADPQGNLVYRGTSRNFNAVMAPAARVAIVEVDEIVPSGALSPEEIVTPGVYVQRIVRRPAGFTGYE